MCEQIYSSDWLAGFCMTISKILSFREAVRVEQKNVYISLKFFSETFFLLQKNIKIK